VELAARHGVEHLRPRAAMVGKEIRSALRNHPRLVLHVLAATGNQQNAGQQAELN
jgi:hypothetical protein